MKRKIPKTPLLASSLLSLDILEGKQIIKKVEPVIDIWHYDVMDGHFVPNITMGPGILGRIREATKKPIDTHLMIADPKKYAKEFAEYSDIITFHIEAVKDNNEAREIIKIIRKEGCVVGVAIKPKTWIDFLADLLPDLDMVLIMTVEPGFGGQAYIDMQDKIQEVKALCYKQDKALSIEVDGGINKNTIQDALSAGADTFVAGSAILGQKDPVKAARELRKKLE